jgi:cell division protein FtsN
MEEYNWSQNQEPTPKPAEPASRLNQEIPKKNQVVESSKNIALILILTIIIIGSFWVSFQLGKKLLVPVKKMPKEKIEVTIPEAPPSVAHLQKLEKLSGLKSATKPTTPAPAVCATKPVVSNSTTKVVSGKYYKLQVGLFTYKSNAVNLTTKLTSCGLEAFYRSVKGKWRVQAGAYRKKSDALNAQKALKKKGYDSIIICE